MCTCLWPITRTSVGETRVTSWISPWVRLRVAVCRRARVQSTDSKCITAWCGMSSAALAMPSWTFTTKAWNCSLLKTCSYSQQASAFLWWAWPSAISTVTRLTLSTIFRTDQKSLQRRLSLVWSSEKYLVMLPPRLRCLDGRAVFDSRAFFNPYSKGLKNWLAKVVTWVEICLERTTN